MLFRSGKKNAAETQRESGKKFVALRKQHSAVESEINSLEHHGLNRGRGAAGLFAVCGLRGDELQPARDRAGVAGAGMGARRDGAAGSLKAAPLETAGQVRQRRCRYRRRILTVWESPHEKSAVHRLTATLNVSRRFRNREFPARY